MIRRFKSFLPLTLLVALFLVTTVHPVDAGASRPLTVVELFTSQGCSSCPPADAYLGELAKTGDGEDVLALSFHVDYWNNLGWPDPYSSPQNTNRQRNYAHHMDLRYVYTPQMVVQGSLQATGSDRRAIQNQINQARKLPRIDVAIERNGQSLAVVLPNSQHPVKADVFMVVFDNEHTTQVKRGENRGKTITNRNVVRSLKRIAHWQGQAIKLASTLGNTGDACAVIVQSRDTGAILGAAKIALN